MKNKPIKIEHKNDIDILSFKDSINLGISNANKVIGNIQEIQSIFTKASEDIAHALDDNDISLKLNANSGLTYMVAFLSKNMDINKLNNSGLITLERGDRKFEFANWKQSSEGYPFTIIYEGTSYDCANGKSLIAFLNSLFSDGAFWFNVNSKLKPENLQKTISRDNNDLEPAKKSDE